MATTNKYEDMSAITALTYAKNKNLLLPDIQREYVWDPQDIEGLFESIVDDYPIGSCILWKTNKKTINEEKPNLYYFIREYQKGITGNEKAPEVLSEEVDYYIVLDGQQRITSLNIALYGSYKIYKGGRGHSWNDPKYWASKELYYNLDYYNSENNDDDEHPAKRFAFLSTEEAALGSYIKVKSILAYDDLDDLLSWMINDTSFSKQTRADLSKLYQRLFDSSSNALIHYYCINEPSYDNALNIFVRVNSTGKKLTKSELLFSILIDGWKTGKNNIDSLLASINSKGDKFSFTRDYLMRLCLVLVDADTNLKVNSFSQTIVQNIRTNWDTISRSIDSMVEVLKDIGLCHEYLTSYNATMPIAYYIYKGGRIADSSSKQEVRKFLSVAMAKRLFGVASNSALNATRNTLRSINCATTPFTLSLFRTTTLTGGRTFTVSETEDIEYWLNNYEKGQNTYTILSLLYPNLKLSQVAFHQDHCHPFASFETRKLQKLQVPEGKIAEWQKKRNLLPNLQFLEGLENESKNQTPLADWVAKGNDFAYHPQNVSLALEDFDAFFNARRNLIKEALKTIFDINTQQNP